MLGGARGFLLTGKTLLESGHKIDDWRRALPFFGLRRRLPGVLALDELLDALRVCVMKLFWMEWFNKGLGELLGKIDFLFL